MSIFGGDEDDRYSDAAMIRAARKRLIEQIAKAEGSPSLVNNVYGGGGGAPHMGGGVMDQLGSKGVSGADEDPFDYLVDITRKNTPDGWEKKVHRYREPKDHKKKRSKAP